MANSIAVSPRSRGRGISKSLLDDAIRRMRDAGAAVLRLETRLDNVAAQALFVQSGFVQRGRKAGYYEDGTDALLFQKSLWNAAGMLSGSSPRGSRLLLPTPT